MMNMINFKVVMQVLWEKQLNLQEQELLELT